MVLGKIKAMFTERKERQVSRNLRLVRNGKAIREDRWAALEYFRSLDDPAVAVPALLDRFEYSLEHGINDTREKEMALEAIVARKEAAIPFVRERLTATTRIAWPIKALKALGNETLVIESLLGALNYGDVAFDQAQVDKNYDVLCYLRDYKVPDAVPKVAFFLKDPDERVRFACIEFLLEQEHPDVPDLVEPFLADASAENLRLRQAAIEAFGMRQWQVKDVSKFPGGQVIGPIFVGPEGKLVRMVQR